MMMVFHTNEREIFMDLTYTASNVDNLRYVSAGESVNINHDTFKGKFTVVAPCSIYSMSNLDGLEIIFNTGWEASGVVLSDETGTQIVFGYDLGHPQAPNLFGARNWQRWGTM